MKLSRLGILTEEFRSRVDSQYFDSLGDVIFAATK